MGLAVQGATHFAHISDTYIRGAPVDEGNLISKEKRAWLRSSRHPERSRKSRSESACRVAYRAGSSSASQKRVRRSVGRLFFRFSLQAHAVYPSPLSYRLPVLIQEFLQFISKAIYKQNNPARLASWRNVCEIATFGSFRLVSARRRQTCASVHIHISN